MEEQGLSYDNQEDLEEAHLATLEEQGLPYDSHEDIYHPDVIEEHQEWFPSH